MDALIENVGKVREKEAKNRKARDKEGHDPGAVANGLENQWIQPLVIAGNQGNRLKVGSRNQLEGGEDSA